MLLAARSLIEEGKTQKLSVNGQPVTGTLMHALSAADLAAAPYKVRNDGERDLQAVVTVTGEAATPEPASARGFELKRSYYTLAGDAVSAKDGVALKQNDRLVVVLEFKPTDGKSGRVLLADRLPAGLEVENPKLVESGSIASLPWLANLANPDHTEFRDDRFVAAMELRVDTSSNSASGEGGEAAAPASTANTLAYVVRAVTPGTYLMPAATLEDMYAPDRFARTGTSTLTVAAQR